jgi:hypothetical protein
MSIQGRALLTGFNAQPLHLGRESLVIAVAQQHRRATLNAIGLLQRSLQVVSLNILQMLLQGKAIPER